MWQADIVDRPVGQNDRGDWITNSVEADIVHFGGTIYVGSPDNYVYAFVAATGEQLWKINSGGGVKGGIAVDKEGDTIFFGTDNNGFFAVHTDDGTEKWHWQDDENDAGDFPAQPTLSSEYVIAGSVEGRIFAWDQDDGERLEWAFPELDDPAKDEPFSHAGFASDGTVYMGNEDGHIYVVTDANGRDGARTLEPKELPYLSEQGCNRSRVPDDADCDDVEEISSEIVEHSDGLVFGSNADQLYMWPIPKGVIKWVYEGQGNILGDIAVQDNLILFAERGGTVVAIDTDEKRKLIPRNEGRGESFDRMQHEWTQSTEEEADVVAGPIINDGVAYWIDRQGILYAYSAQTGREQFQMPLWTGQCRRCTAKPLVHANLIFVATADGYLKAIRLPD